MPGVMGGAAKNDRLATDAAIVGTSLVTFNGVYRRLTSIPDASRNNTGDPQQLVVTLDEIDRAYQDSLRPNMEIRLGAFWATRP